MPSELSWWLRDSVCDANAEPDDTSDAHRPLHRHSVRRYLCGLPTMHARHGMSQLLRAGNVRAGVGWLRVRTGNHHTDPHADSDRQSMQPVSARLPGWKTVQLLLRYLGMHAAFSPLLCASLFGADAATDSNAVHDTHLSPTPSVPVPAG